MIKNIIRKIKCFFGRHKYNYQMGNWTGGRYEDIYLTCDWCSKNFLKMRQSELFNNPNNI